jgi:hypothetical protein
MFQARVAGFLQEDGGVVRRCEDAIDRLLVHDRALHERQALATCFEYPQLQKRAQATQGTRRVAISQRRRA